jgi:hypothetical protein
MSHWAIVNLYEPFRFGPPWSWYRYEVPGAEDHEVAGFDAFAFLDPCTNEWEIHEAITGGWLASHAQKKYALEIAANNIRATRDFREQIQKLGPSNALPVANEGFQAIRRQLAKNKKREPGRTLEIDSGDGANKVQPSSTRNLEI